MARKAYLAGGLAMVAVLVVLALRFSREPAAPTVLVETSPAAQQPPQTSAPAATKQAPPPDMSYLPRAGFDRAGDEQLLSPDFLDVFHQILFHHYGYPREMALGALEKWMGRFYTPEEAAQIRAAFLKYLDLIDRMQAPDFYAGAKTMREKFERLHALRREVLGESLADALFHEDELATDYALAVSDLYHDESLQDAQREKKIAELEEALPEELRQEVAWKDPRTEYYEELRELAEKSSGLELDRSADVDQLHELRVKHFGEEAAERLDALDAQRAERRERWQRYQEDRQDLLGEAAQMGLSSEELQEELRKLRTSTLSPEEAREAEARELLNGLSAQDILELIAPPEMGR